jgi:hypothetical protein
LNVNTEVTVDEDPEQELRSRVRRLALDWHAETHEQFREATAETIIEMLRASTAVLDEAHLDQHRWVEVARQSGMSWTEISGAVGMSKQGVAQKFDRAKLKGEHPMSSSKNQEIIRFGATLLNEVKMLEVEGRNGLELQRLAPLSLIFTRSPLQWEYKRVSGLSIEEFRASLSPDGWTHVASYTPFYYFKRPLDRQETSAR